MKQEQKKQLRGDELLSAIRTAIEHQASLAASKGIQYKYIESHIAAKVGCTRRTLDRHNKFITEILENLAAPRRKRDGSKFIETLQKKIDFLESQVKNLNSEKEALVSYHLAIYDNLTQYSVNPSLLIPKLNIAAKPANPNCVFCGATTTKSGTERPKIVTFRLKGESNNKVR